MELNVFIAGLLYAVLLEFLHGGGKTLVASAEANFGPAPPLLINEGLRSPWAPQQQQQQQRHHYWRELEAELYLAEFLNLTKSLLVGSELGQKLGQCVQLVDSLSRCQLAVGTLMEASNSERLYEQSEDADDGEQATHAVDFLAQMLAQFHQQSSLDRQRRGLEACATLSIMTSLFYDCLYGVSREHNHPGGRELHEQLLELNGHMQKLAQVVDHVSLGQAISFIEFLPPSPPPTTIADSDSMSFPNQVNESGSIASESLLSRLKSTLVGWRERIGNFIASLAVKDEILPENKQSL